MSNLVEGSFAHFVRVCNSKSWDGTSIFELNKNEDEFIRSGLTDPDFTFIGNEGNTFAFGHMAADKRWRKGGSKAPTSYDYNKNTGIGFVGTNNHNQKFLVISPMKLIHMSDDSISSKLVDFSTANPTRTALAGRTADINGSAEVNIIFSLESPNNENHDMISLDNLNLDFTIIGDYYQHNSTNIKLNRFALDKCLKNYRFGVKYNPV